jgi:hypothetical protein
MRSPRPSERPGPRSTGISVSGGLVAVAVLVAIVLFGLVVFAIDCLHNSGNPIANRTGRRWTRYVVAVAARGLPRAECPNGRIVLDGLPNVFEQHTASAREPTMAKLTMNRVRPCLTIGLST